MRTKTVPLSSSILLRGLFFALLLATHLMLQAQDQGKIKGKVTDSNGDPIEFATVKVFQNGIMKAGANTDEKGEFSIAPVAPGSYEIEASYAGNSSGKRSVNVGVGETVLVNLKIETAVELQLLVITDAKQERHASVRPSHKKEKLSNIQPSPSTIQPIAVPVPNGAEGDQQPEPSDREGYDHIEENRFLDPNKTPQSTFSIDVDAASYSNVRRIIQRDHRLPPAGAVRLEEFINYFDYIYPQPKGEHPFSINTEVAACPWDTEHQLVLIGLQGLEMEKKQLPPNNLVFLVDVSGSMSTPDKLPLLQQSLNMLVDQMRPEDNVALVAYAGAAGLVLAPTSGKDKQKIKDAIESLKSGGSTAGGAGIQLAYKVAMDNFLKEGNNRVILCTDGDFNVGMSSDDELVRLIEEKRKSGVFLSVLGFGTGNYQDAKMEKLADNGNGNLSYIDQLLEAQKVLVKEMGGTLVTIAKDVKIQVEFNPTKVQSYRLIGYENRVMQAEDFDNDKKDAGELGAGHSVTALYEIVPVQASASAATTPENNLHFQDATLNQNAATNQLLWVKFRYKAPQDSVSKLIEQPLMAGRVSFEKASENLRWAAAVAGFGMILRDSKHKGKLDYEMVKALASNAIGKDEEGYRAEFLRIVKEAELMKKD